MARSCWLGVSGCTSDGVWFVSMELELNIGRFFPLPTPLLPLHRPHALSHRPTLWTGSRLEHCQANCEVQVLPETDQREGETVRELYELG